VRGAGTLPTGAGKQHRLRGGLRGGLQALLGQMLSIAQGAVAVAPAATAVTAAAVAVPLRTKIPLFQYTYQSSKSDDGNKAGGNNIAGGMCGPVSSGVCVARESASPSTILFPSTCLRLLYPLLNTVALSAVWSDGVA
jgi:hypothetical protein